MSCCGSTLSFVAEPARAVSEFGRVLRPGGVLLLECERRWSLDLLWMLVSSVTADSLGYGVGFRALLRQLAKRPAASVVVDYPGYPGLRLFTRSELGAMLRDAGLTPVRAWGIHAVTNLIPSTILHRAGLGAILTGVYRRLRAVDRALAGSRPARWMANSLVLLAGK